MPVFEMMNKKNEANVFISTSGMNGRSGVIKPDRQTEVTLPCGAYDGSQNYSNSY